MTIFRPCEVVWLPSDEYGTVASDVEIDSTKGSMMLVVVFAQFKKDKDDNCLREIPANVVRKQYG